MRRNLLSSRFHESRFRVAPTFKKPYDQPRCLQVQSRRPLVSYDKYSLSGLSVCVTGGAGFIGSHLVDALVHCGSSVRVLDDLSTGKLDNLSCVLPNIEFLEGSVLSQWLVEKALASVDIVYHLAAQVSVPRSFRQPDRCFAINELGTRIILDAARNVGVSRVVFASSSSVYGSPESLPICEDTLLAPTSPYGKSKMAGELTLRKYCEKGGSGLALRLFNVFGARQRSDTPDASVIARFVNLARHGQELPVYGDGLQLRDFTWIRDVVEAFLRASRHGLHLGEGVNIASGKSHTVLDLGRDIANLYGHAPRFEFMPERTETKCSQACIHLARAVLDYSPSVTLQQALRSLVQEDGQTNELTPLAEKPIAR